MVGLALSGQAYAQKTVEVRLGAWRASYSRYATPAAVCDAEPQWLAEELHSVNRLLDAFLALGTTRNGAWTEAQLPLLEQAQQVLPELLEAHTLALSGLSRCELRNTGRFPQILEQGLALVKEAQVEVGQLPQLIRFTRHRVALERWEAERAQAQRTARAGCKQGKGASGVIYFAWQDEFGTRRWAFCDDGVVVAPAGKPWSHQPADGAPEDAKVASTCIQIARLHAEALLVKAPVP